ncbi:MAG: TRAP transporter large permease subunit [Rhizobiales bacterium]|nr:TRAP transporter large permease subunit [Hyphomicrobiales bacterium]
MELFFLLLLVVIMAYALGSGYPVAFALPGAAIVTIAIAALAGYIFAGNPDAYFSHGGPVQWLSSGVTNLRGVYWEPERDTLIAIPLFIFMGIMLQRSKIAEDLLVAMAQLFGPIPGGLGISVVVVGALLAATTGIVGATVVAMGLISLPAMLKQNYSKPLATGTIAASGTLGQIIPPSIVLIILADQLASAVDQADTTRKTLYKASTGELTMPSEYSVVSTSAGDMFLGALVPGLLLVALYILYILFVALVRPRLAPAVPYEGKYDLNFAGRMVLIMVPPLTLILLVLGSIIGGIATVNQAGAIGAAGALVMAGYRLFPGQRTTYIPVLIALLSIAGLALVLANYPVNIKSVNTNADKVGLALAILFMSGLIFSILWSGWRTLKIENTMQDVMLDTAKTTSLVFIILLGAAMLTAAFRAFGGEDLVRDFLESMPGGFWTKFLIVMLVIFILGFFLDFIEIAVVVVPITTPILLADPTANVTAVWLGVMIGLNLQTSFLTPPFGFALFYLRGVAPAAVKTLDMYKGVIAFISLQILALFIVGLNPWLVNYLPSRSTLLSDTAPPPLNPNLQYCMENYVSGEFQKNGTAIKAAITRAEGLDLSYLPKDMAKELKDSFGKAASTFGLMEEIDRSTVNLNAAGNEFRPIHTQVRAIERDIFRLNILRKEQQTRLSRARGSEKVIASAEKRIKALDEEITALKAKIPDTWLPAQNKFEVVANAERKARETYRRTVDAAAKPLEEALITIRSYASVVTAQAPLDALKADLAAQSDINAAANRIKDTEAELKDIEGTSEIRSALGKARRAMSGSKADRAKGDDLLNEAFAEFEESLVWRKRAAEELEGPLTAYEAAIADTIALRAQPRLPRPQALSVAACSSSHRDIGLNF